jgi:glucokinase
MLLAGDIGGTRSRFYAIDQDNLVFEHIYSSKDYQDFLSIIRDFLKISGMKFSKCVFGIAGIVVDGYCKTTNLPWEVRLNEIKQTLGVSEGYLINDLELLSYGLSGLDANKLTVLQKGEKKEGPLLLICPGTGLGVALVRKSKMSLEIFPTEAGHVDFSPTTHEQIELLEHFLDQFGHVSLERFVSGSGLLNIYKFFSQKAGVSLKLSSSEQITEAALQGSDELAKKSCHIFLDMLASTLGNLALNYLPYQGLYICGALIRKLFPLIDQTRFLNLMSCKGRFSSFLKKIPLYLVNEPQLAFLGSVVFFKNLRTVPDECS